MHSSLTAMVLCVFAQTAAAQCLDTTPFAGPARQANAVVKTSTGVAHTAPRSGGDLIKTAAAGTRDAPVTADEVAPDSLSTQAAPAGSDHQPRSGKAMLLAAVAVMSGSALRRYSANSQ